MFIVVLCFVLWRMVSQSGQSARVEEPSYSEFIGEVDRGNVKEVAAFLGKDRKQIYRWLRRERIDPDAYRRSDP